MKKDIKEKKVSPVLRAFKDGDREFLLLINSFNGNVLWDERKYLNMEPNDSVGQISNISQVDVLPENKSLRKRNNTEIIHRGAVNEKVHHVPKKGIYVEGDVTKNPGGIMSYRGYDISTGEEIFCLEESEEVLGTNLLACFLGISHAVGYLESNDDIYSNNIYCNNFTSVHWAEKRQQGSYVFYGKKAKEFTIAAEEFLKESTVQVNFKRWYSKYWGEFEKKA